MGYMIEGDGTNLTKIWLDGVPVEWKTCRIYINPDYCEALVDWKKAPLDRVLLLGVYKVIGEGAFANTRIFIGDEMLRGVQSLVIKIGTEPKVDIQAVFLPNLIEGEDRNEV